MLAILLEKMFLEFPCSYIEPGLVSTTGASGSSIETLEAEERHARGVALKPQRQIVHLLGQGNGQRAGLVDHGLNVIQLSPLACGS